MPKNTSFPLVIYDGDCGFCVRWITKIRQYIRGKIEFISYQQGISDISGLTLEECQKSVQYIDKHRKRYSGAYAVNKIMTHIKWFSWMVKLYEKSQVIADFQEKAYTAVAVNRPFFSKLSRFLFGPSKMPSSFKLSSWLFAKGLFVVYFIAFSSLFVQVKGLFGSKGIIPISLVMNSILKNPTFGFLNFPTIFWFNTSDTFIQGVLIIGILLSVIGILGYFQKLNFFFLWLIYLSFKTSGQYFLNFQWDILLLEAGFLAILLVPLKVSNKLTDSPHTLAHIAIRWLLFRVMFASGLVKLISGDPTWMNGTALNYHFFTQPLPNIFSWYIHQLPSWCNTLLVLIILFIELIVASLILFPRHLRRWAFWPLVSLQLAICLTGNYGFFNLLVLVLTLTLIEDHYIPDYIRNIIQKCDSLTPALQKSYHHFFKVNTSKFNPLSTVIILLIFAISLSEEIPRFTPFKRPLGKVIRTIDKTVSPYCLVNNYGLFAVMTTTRSEIQFFGSNDGIHWKVYDFTYKPGNLSKAPSWAQPHQPRLDWQLWFAALGSIRNNPWVLGFMQKLLEGENDVLNLLESNPFPESPPKHVKAELVDYQFTDFNEKQKTGNWWKAKSLRTYAGPFTLKN